ncbi:unnamed protein product [Owenia fusiformis]|uniref:CUB domain-containing protein n=1 Tax=Owenia fusiformis TaxID=6347 RepID=A0A8S4NGF2_OWEFU|nr:unnamed protein product [Owenia fusiformis]
MKRFIVVFAALHAVISKDFNKINICNFKTDHRIQVDLNDHGEIHSPNYPESFGGAFLSPASCYLTLYGCPECKIELRFTEIVLPPCDIPPPTQDTCVDKCDTLFVYEEFYTENTIAYIQKQNVSKVFTSISNSVTLKLCMVKRLEKRFKINYVIQEKKQYFTLGPNGTIRGPNFPKGYAMQGEKYSYLIKNPDVNGFIRIVFDDWNLNSKSSQMLFYNDESEKDVIFTSSGYSRRPAVQSSGPVLLVVFKSGWADGKMIGFKGTYEFVTKSTWTNKPTTACGSYNNVCYNNGLITCGVITFNSYSQTGSGYFDCNWSLTTPKGFHAFYLKLKTFRLNQGWREWLNSLEIRRGVSSDGALLGHYKANDTPQDAFDGFVDTSGFYVRLKGVYHMSDLLEVTFTAFIVPTSHGCDLYRYFPCSNDRCVSRDTMCDGTNHCGDNSDESLASCEASKIKVCKPYETLCSNKYQCVPSTKICDDWPDCQRTSSETISSDELNCKVTTVSSSTSNSCVAPTWFECDNGQCIHNWKKCDNIVDCEDKSDEKSAICDKETSSNGYNYWQVVMPVGLSLCIALFLCVLILCMRSLYKRKQRRRRMQAARSNLSTINRSSPAGAAPGTGRQTQISFSITSTELGFDMPDRQAPPSYDDTMRYEGNVNMAFSNSMGRLNLDDLPPPPAYTPLNVTATQNDDNSEPPVAPTRSERRRRRRSRSRNTNSESSEAITSENRPKRGVEMAVQTENISDYDNAPKDSAEGDPDQVEITVAANSPAVPSTGALRKIKVGNISKYIGRNETMLLDKDGKMIPNVKYTVSPVEPHSSDTDISATNVHGSLDRDKCKTVDNLENVSDENCDGVKCKSEDPNSDVLILEASNDIKNPSQSKQRSSSEQALKTLFDSNDQSLSDLDPSKQTDPSTRPPTPPISKYPTLGRSQSEHSIPQLGYPTPTGSSGSIPRVSSTGKLLHSSHNLVGCDNPAFSAVLDKQYLKFSSDISLSDDECTV